MIEQSRSGSDDTEMVAYGGARGVSKHDPAILAQIAAIIKRSDAVKQARALSIRDVLGYTPRNRHERRRGAKLLRQAAR